MDQLKPGDETQAYCTSCKTVGEHLVVAMVGDKPAKVECTECHKQHLYRAAAPGAAKESKSPRKPSKKAMESAPKPPPIDWMAQIAGREARAYDPKLRFAVGDVVRHPSFGVGIVTAHPGAQKMEMAFPGGPKLLSHDRGAVPVAPALVRPVRRDDDERKTVTDAPPAPRAR